MTDASTDLVGTTLADTYIIDSLLGEGGMGRVYLARHTRIDAKRFAIKVLHEEFAQHTEALERFKREAEATAAISSPHVIGVHDVGKTPDGLPFIASDFLEGEELAVRLERLGQLDVGEGVRIVRQVCAGLAAAHQQGVVHRDVKPENVFLVGSPEASTAKLLDFGISRLTDQNAKALTQAGIALGTPDFMSPEQARGKPVDHRCDVYAAGVLLYATLTGVSPFERESPQESLMALLTEEAPPPTTFDASIPKALEAVIEKAMAKEAEARYPTVFALYEALAPFDPTSAVQAPAPVAPAAAPRVTEPGAPVLVAPPPPPAETTAHLALYGGLGGVAAYLSLFLGIGGILRAADIKLGAGGQLILGLLLAAAFGPLAALGGLHIRGLVASDPRASRIAGTVKSAVIAGCVTYAVFAMLIRVGQIVVLGDAKGVGAPLYDVLLLLAAAGGAVVAAGLGAKR